MTLGFYESVSEKGAKWLLRHHRGNVNSKKWYKGWRSSTDESLDVGDGHLHHCTNRDCSFLSLWIRSNIRYDCQNWILKVSKNMEHEIKGTGDPSQKSNRKETTGNEELEYWMTRLPETLRNIPIIHLAIPGKFKMSLLCTELIWI